MENLADKDVLKAGTGFMNSMTDSIHHFEKKGYLENLVLRFDHLECQSGKFRLFPKDFVVDEVSRFENTSDPDDQSILYAISCPIQNLKGVLIENYGSNTEEMSQEMADRLKNRENSPEIKWQ